MHAIQLGPLLTDGEDGTLKVVVRKWLQGGGAQRDEVEAQYGPISDWNVPQVTFRELGLTDQQITTLLEGIMSVMCSQQMFPSVTCMVSRGNRDTLLLNAGIVECTMLEKLDLSRTNITSLPVGE